MLIKLSKNNPLFQYALVISVSLALWGKSFVETGFTQSGCWLAWAISLSCAIGFCLILTKHRISRNPGLHAVVLLCLSAATLHAAYFSKMWVYLLFLLSFYYLLDIYSKDKPYPALFNAIFFWSTATIVFPEMLFTLPCFWIILLTYAVGNWHVWGASLLAMGTPYLLAGAYDILAHETLLQQNFSHFITFCLPNYATNLPAFLLLFFCILLSLISVFSMQKHLQGMEIIERRKVISFIVLFIYLLIFMIVGGGNKPEHLFPLFLPVSFLCTDAIVYMRNGILKETLFALILLAGISITWFSF